MCIFTEAWQCKHLQFHKWFMKDGETYCLKGTKNISISKIASVKN